MTMDRDDVTNECLDIANKLNLMKFKNMSKFYCPQCTGGNDVIVCCRTCGYELQPKDLKNISVFDLLTKFKNMISSAAPLAWSAGNCGKEAKEWEKEAIKLLRIYEKCKFQLNEGMNDDHC